jgi:beta-glucosidase
MILLAGTQKEENKIEKENRLLAREAAGEGIVLLKNSGILPLKNKKIALYGSGARMTVKGGIGSGAVRERYSVSVEEGLLNAGYEIATQGWLNRFDLFYKDAYQKYNDEVEEKVAGVREFFQILHLAGKFDHPTGIPVTVEDIKESETDTAIYVLARQAGEGTDRMDIQGDYRLDEVERENLKLVSQEYQHLIVVVNVGGVIDLGFMDEITVDALVYMVQGGEEGGNALADLLSGEKNFSGKLATSWAHSFDDIPSHKTYSYLGNDPYNQEYKEGIYVGYRFFDTFGIKPRYHFGFGLSYTDFAIEVDQIESNNEMTTVLATVTNTGEIAGKEVLQLYASVPFGSGAEYQRLVAFQKTKLIEPGKKLQVKLQFATRDLAIYSEEKHAYLLSKGDYVLRLGNASNTTNPAGILRLNEEVVTEICTNICPVKHEIKEIVPPERIEKNLQGVPVYELKTKDFITTKHNYSEIPVFPDASVKEKIESMTIQQLATLVCGGTTKGERLVNAVGASGTTTSLLYEDCGIPNVILSDGPAGLNLTPQVVELPDGTIKAAKVPEVIEAYKRYYFGFNKIALGSQLAKPEEGTVHYQYATAWPCSQLLAQTFNTLLLEQIGDAVGKEMEEFGVTIWLAPGINIHRNPLCGRTFEYYSEDPFVSGKMAAAIIRGVQSHEGKGMSIKHFVANNCELERNRSSSNMTEKTLRELYLKGFEIAIKESKPMTVMASYNLINGVYATNNYDTLVKVLRNEWGFEGMVMSDWDSITADNEDCMKAATGDVLKALTAQCDLIMPGRPDQIEALVKGVEQGIVKEEDLKRSAGRVLAMIRKNTIVASK